MAQVYIVKEDSPPGFVSWAVYRVTTTPFRQLAAAGFATVSEARRWAKKWQHEVVTLKIKRGAP